MVSKMLQDNAAENSSLMQKKWNWWLLATSVVIYFFVNFQRSSIPGTIFNELQSDFQATAAQVTNISAVFMYVYAATQLVAGLAADKFGGVRTIFWGALLLCVGSLIFPLCSNMGLLLLGRVLVGLGCGAIYLAIVKEIDRVYPEKFTSVLGTVILLGYAGSIIGGWPLSKAVQFISWRWAFAAAAVLTLIGYLGFIYCKKQVAIPKVRREKLSLLPFIVVLKSRNCRWLLIAGGVGYAVYYLMLAVMGKKLLEDICQTPASTAGFCVSLMVIVAAGMNFLVGYLSTRFGNLRKPFLYATLAASVVGAVMGLIGLKLHAGTWYFVIVMQLFAASAGFSPVSNSLMREYTPAQYTGSGASVLNFVAYLAVAVCGNLAGILMDAFSDGKVVKAGVVIYPASSYAAVLTLSLIIGVSALLAGLMLPETYGKNIYKQEKLQLKARRKKRSTQ